MLKMISNKTSHHKARSKLIFLATVCLILSACSTAPTSKLQPAASHAYAPFTYKQSELDKLVQWDVEGKLAVFANDKNNSGLLTWRQRSEYFDLLISGPLGSGQLHIEGTPRLAIATSSKGQVEAESIELLFLQEFGWVFPMQELRYWALGIPHPASEATLSYNETGEAASIHQSDWQVKYHSYSNVTGLPMPKKIEISGLDVRLVLILKSWFNLYPFPRSNPNFNPQ